MRRAIDTARTKLETLDDRQAILDCWFAYAKGLFQYSALFVMRGEAMQGRDAAGIGAPPQLVARLTFTAEEPSLFVRARELRRPFTLATYGAPTAADARLFGTLGRTMATGVVVPLVVRDRVVAVFIGDAPIEPLQNRARELGRLGIDLAKEEMLLWSGNVGDALERVILRKKGSLPPPPLGGSVRPSSAPSAGAAPAPVIPRAPATPSEEAPPPSVKPLKDRIAARPIHTPVIFDPSIRSSDGMAPASQRHPGTSSRITSWIIGGVLAVATIVGAIVLVLPYLARDRDGIAVPAARVPGAPGAVDPLGTLAMARTTAGPAGSALAEIRAEVTKQGVVDLAKPAANREGVALEYVFLANEGESVIRADAAGLHAPRSAPWPPCAPDKPCRFSVPAPTCTFPAIRAAASAVGVGDDDRALVTYADGRAPNGSGTNGPEWTVTVAGRGAAHFDATTCKPVAGERLVPAALPLAEIPGAPKDVDPIALLPIAKARSGLEADAVLLEIDVRGMSSAGKVDLSAPDTGILYTFADPPRGAQRRWRVVEVGKYGIPVTSTSDDHLPLPTRLESGGIDAPACTLSFLFTTIGTMPADATAHVVYAPDSANPEAGALTVDVPGAGIHRTLTDAMCRAWEKLPQTPKPR